MAPHIDREELAAEYGWSLAFFRSNPELEHLFNQAVAGTWTPEKFVAELRGTKWFQDHSASYRQYLVNKVVDPASWQDDYDRTHAMIADAYGSLFGKTLPQNLSKTWTERAMMFGWSDAEIKDHIVNSMNVRKLLFHEGGIGGQAANLLGQVNSLAGQYGVKPSHDWMTNNIRAVMLGNQTLDGLTQQIKRWAINKYAGFADQIKAGKTVADIADPYVQEMAQLLELNPNDVGLNSTYIQRALTHTVQEGKGRQTIPSPMTLTDFSQMVRSDPRWWKTNQARDTMQQIASGLGQAWGLL